MTEGQMKSTKYCVYNKTSDGLLSMGVPVIDTTNEPFKSLIEDLTVNAETGLWLRPFRGIPEARHLPRFDLVYLDEEDRVVEAVEMYSAVEFTPFDGRAASALVLPSHSISSSHTRSGDQLKISFADDEAMVRLLARTPRPAGSLPSAPNGGSGIGMSGIHAVPLTMGAGDRSTKENDQIGSQGKPSFKKRVMGWLFPVSDRRRGNRRPLQGLVAYYWTGGAPQSYFLGNISATGFYLLTDERWVLDTMIQMNLQKTDSNGSHAADSVSVLAKVSRWGVDGVGLEFVYEGRGADRKPGPFLPGRATDLDALARFLQGIKLPENVERELNSR
jgi:hypothetical protein